MASLVADGYGSSSDDDESVDISQNNSASYGDALSGQSASDSLDGSDDDDDTEQCL